MTFSGTVIPVMVGFFTGILSGFGIGGGSLLILYLTIFAGVSQKPAQGINLIYFLFAAPASLYSHIKNKLINIKHASVAVISGILSSVFSAFVVADIKVSYLRLFFGMIVIYIGLTELFFRKAGKSS